MLRRENANRPRPTNTNSPNSTMARRVRLKAIRPLTMERALPYPLVRSTGVGPPQNWPRKFGCPRSHVMFLGAMQHALTVKVGDERHLISRRSPCGVPVRPAPQHLPCQIVWPSFLAVLAGPASGPCILAAPFDPRVWPPPTLAQAEPGYPRMDTFPPIPRAAL